jgi:hypothetical protein
LPACTVETGETGNAYETTRSIIQTRIWLTRISFFFTEITFETSDACAVEVPSTREPAGAVILTGIGVTRVNFTTQITHEPFAASTNKQVKRKRSAGCIVETG